jgi:putative membrane protein
MRPFFLHWLVVAIALGLTAWLVPGVGVSSPLALLVAALVYGFLNALLKPILVLLTLPLTVMTLGLFYLVLNAILFALAAVLVPGFVVTGFGPAFVGAILMSLLSMLLGWLTGTGRAQT